MIKVGPYLHAAFNKTYDWGKVIKTNRNRTRTQTQIIRKSDAWLYALCTGNCPTNCTGHEGEATDWGYVKKSINPIRPDRTIPDPSLKVMCKGIK